jgi:hypothetical protein
LTSSTSSTTARSRELVVIAGLVLVAVVLPFFVTVIAGSVEIPRNDDWAYRRIATELAQTGRFVLDGITETMLIGQVLVSQPFLWIGGVQPATFTVIGVAFGVAGIASAYALARSVLGRRDAALAAGLLVLFPGYLSYATSYMSDVPTLAAEFVCLTLGVIALRARPVSMRFLGAAALAGLLGFSIREFAVAAPASVMLAAICVDVTRRRVWAIALTTGASCIAIHLWRTSLPGQLPPLGSGWGSLYPPLVVFMTAALAISPAALVAAITWRRRFHAFDVLMGGTVGAWVALFRVVIELRGTGLFMGSNLASAWGTHPGYLEGSRPYLFSDELWTLLNLMTLAAVVAVPAVGAGILGARIRGRTRSIGTVVRRFGSPVGLLAIFCMCVFVGLFVFGLSRPVFDRYVWPLVTPAAAILLVRPRAGEVLAGRSRGLDRVLMVVAIATTATLAVTSLVYLLNSHAFSAARWQAGERLVAAGIPADEIDAGYEWVGYNATTAGDPTKSVVAGSFYRSWWPDMPRCGLATTDPEPPTGAQLVGKVTYELTLVAGPESTIYLYRYPTALCPIG